MEALSELGPEIGAHLLEGRSAEEIARYVQELESDDAAAIVEALPEDLSRSVLDLMRGKQDTEVEELLEYPEYTAGRIMNPNVFALSEDLTVGEAITELQGARDVEMVFYLYTIDERNHLVGVTSLRRLLLVAPETPLKRIAGGEVLSVRVDTDQEEVARQVASYNLLAIPVVDLENKLAGVITVDDVIDVIKDEATEDIYRLAGVSSDDSVFSPPLSSLRKRLPWLYVNLATAFLAAAVVKMFEPTISQATALAVFMPVVAGMGGNAGMQTLTVIVRGIALGELTFVNSRKALVKEALVGLGNGVGIGVDRGRGGVAGAGRRLAGADPGAGHDHQHVRGGHCRDARAAGAARPEDRPRAGVVGVHHDADRRVRVLRVPRSGARFPQAPPRGGVEYRTGRMPLHTGEALVLRTYRLGETDRLVVLLTRDRGKKRGVARGGAAVAQAVRRARWSPSPTCGWRTRSASSATWFGWTMPTCLARR